jgi:glycosidase
VRGSLKTGGIVAAIAAALACCQPRRGARASETVATSGLARPSAVAGWRRGATCYEIFVRSFQDSDGDGIGDLRGLTQKLDYLNDGDPATSRDLGVRCVWLMPVNEAASYHGYDATDYYQVERDFGTTDDFRRFVVDAHRRGIAVLIDMVLNHLSSDHPYFRDALGGPAAAHRSWFRFSATKPNEPGPWGQEVWHRSPVRDEYYYGVFWHGMPDLNYETPAVREEAKRIAAFWLTEMGVDGFRLDAVPYLVEEGTRQIGTAGTHAFLREYASAIRRVAPDVFTVGEVWDGIDRMLPYYPDQLESYFAFDLSDALIDAMKKGSAQALLDRYARFQREVPDARYSTFLRNHDETRTLTAVGGDIARARLAATLLFTLPGLPFVYYGEEIGMSADKPDEQLRTPMQWSAEPAAGFTRGKPWEPLTPAWEMINVARQDADSGSLLSLYRRLIRLRATRSALGAGDLVPLATPNGAVAAYIRRSGGEVVLVLANLSAASLATVELSSPPSTLPPGDYSATRLDGTSAVRKLTVGADGRVRGYVPVDTVAPLASYIVELARTS